MGIEKLFVKASMFLPENIIKSFESLMVQGGFSVSAREYAGYSLLLSILVTIAAEQAAEIFVAREYAIALAIFTFFVMMGLFYLLILMTADNRARRIEEVLPDALQMISANIRAGMTLENAIWMAAKPELGPLEEEIRIVSGKAFGGKPITSALSQMAERIRSARLDRSVKLLNEGIKLGGEVAPLLDEVAQDLKMNNMLSKEIASATTMYMIFIIFTAVIASPVMFAASAYYAEMAFFISGEQSSNVPGSGMGTGMAGAGVSGSGFSSLISAGERNMEEMITPDEFIQFAVACVMLTTFFCALTLSVIRQGKMVRGVKYVPVFIIAGITIFFVTLSLLRNMFGFLFT